MNDLINAVVYWVGVTTCVAGGILLAAVMAGLAFDRVVKTITNVRAVSRILYYAHSQGLDLVTGEKNDETPAH